MTDPGKPFDYAAQTRPAFGFGKYLKLIRDTKNRLVWGAKAPLSDETLFVNPLQIEWQFDDAASTKDNCPHAHISSGRQAYLNSGRVLDGDWDRYRKPVTATFKYKACFRHFIKGVSWEETGIYEFARKRIARTGRFDGCETDAEVVQRYEELDRLFDQIARDGRLKPQSEIRGAASWREEGGIYCHIGHDGQFLRYLDGNHRFVIARLLKLPEIPVRVGVVHKTAVEDGVMPAHRLPKSTG